MKIKIELTLNVDPEAWALDYGIELKDVRADVKTYFVSHCEQQLEALDNQFKPTN